MDASINENCRKVTEEEVDAYFTASQQTYKSIAVGVFIIMMGVVAMLLSRYIFSQMLFIPSLPNIHRTIPVVILLFCIAVASASFITSGFRFEKYEYMEKGVCMEPSVRERLERELEQYAPTSAMFVTVGVVLCILGPAVFLLLKTFLPDTAGTSAVGVSILLIMIAAAVVLFIVNGGRKAMYEKVLGIREYAPEHDKEKKVIGVTAAIVWPLTVAAFLVWRLCFEKFEIAWIVFPVAGILFGSFAAICSVVLQKSNNHRCTETEG